MTRLATLEVLQRLRPADTGHHLPRCSWRAGRRTGRSRCFPSPSTGATSLRGPRHGAALTPPRASVVVSELAAAAGLGPLAGRRRLDDAGRRAVEL